MILFPLPLVLLLLYCDCVLGTGSLGLNDDCEDTSLCAGEQLILDYPVLEDIFTCNEEITPAEAADQPIVTLEGAEEVRF